jgi:D-beta-D-heptose 7-phosphate kinase/D-beta-D-heptose 1-phosphate adenosyltransferase
MKKPSLKNQRKNIVAISGGFDPIHIGHIRLINEAKALGDELVVIMNNDHWLRAKKGYIFMPQKERKELLLALSAVDKVIYTSHKKNTKYSNQLERSVVKELSKLKPDIFANGGDRFLDEIPENKLCKKLGIKMVFNIGKGGKIQSSSVLVGKAAKKTLSKYK